MGVSVHHIGSDRALEGPVLQALREAPCVIVLQAAPFVAEDWAALPGDDPTVHEVRTLLAAAPLVEGDAARALRERAQVRVAQYQGLLQCAHLKEEGLSITLLPDMLVEAVYRAGRPHLLAELSGRRLRARLEPLLAEGCSPVIVGCVGRAPEGGGAWLGREGSAEVATLAAASVGAEETIFWTTGTRLRAADPDVVPDAVPIAHLNYREAAEMRGFGGPLPAIHTLRHAAGSRVPLRIETLDGPVRVDGHFRPGALPVKAVAALSDHALVTIEGTGMAGVPGTAARIFGALAEAGVNVTLISQSSAESSVTLVVPGADAAPAEVALKEAFRMDLGHGEIGEITTRRGVAIVAAIGLGMAHSPGVAGRALGALGEADVSVLAIAQGSSELNISIVVRERDRAASVQALCSAFGLREGAHG